MVIVSGSRRGSESKMNWRRGSRRGVDYYWGIGVYCVV